MNREGTIDRSQSLARLSATQRAEVRKRWRKGKKLWQIAQELKLDPRQIYQVVREIA